MFSTSQIIVKSLLKDEDYVRKVKPFIKDEYFEDETEKVIFNGVKSYFDKYNGLPSKEALIIDLNNNPKLSEKQVDKAGELITTLHEDKSTQAIEWLLDKTEKWCQDQAIYNSIMESIHIIEEAKNGKGKRETGAIPEILSKALSVCFDPNVGHDYLEQEEERFALYHEPLSRISWGVEELDKITKKGIPAKTLTVLVGGVNVGKTLCMCHFAASFMKQGYNVLYITLEISEKEIARRIDANMLDVNIDEILELPKQPYMTKVAKMKNGVSGKLIIKEYPTASASASNFKFLLDELRLKKNFRPDVVLIDYINICTSSRVKVNTTGSTYAYIKMIAEELRGLAVEYNTRVLSATQLTRSGFSDSDPDMTDVAESFGLPATADFMAAIVSNEKLESLNQYMIKQIKNRFGNSTKYKKFFIGVDRDHQRLYQLSSNARTVDDEEDSNEGNNKHARRNKTSGGTPASNRPEHVPYKSAYRTGLSRQYGPRNTEKFSGLKVE